MFTRKMKLVPAMIVAIGMSSPVMAWNVLDLNAPGNLDGEAFQGSFSYVTHDSAGNEISRTVYGPANAKPVAGYTTQTQFDLDLLDAFVLYGKDGLNGHGHNDNTQTIQSNDDTYAAYPGAPVVYRMYRQNHSAAIVNLSRGTGARHFVKSVVGDVTTVNPYVVQGDYTYSGIAFSNFPRGGFDYTVNVAANNAVTGSGSFTLNDIKIPGSQRPSGEDKFFNITDGKLLETTLAATSSGLVFDGVVSIDPITGVSDSGAWAEIDGPLATDAYYTLKAFGPNGEELAGAIHGLPSRVGSVAIIGAQTAQP